MKEPSAFVGIIPQIPRAERTPGAAAVSLYGAGAWPRILDQASTVLGSFPAPAAEQTQSPGGDGVTSLVSIGHNSSTGTKTAVCPNCGWLMGTCEHATQRWVKLSCKRRVCPVCGEERKHRISWRIQLGLEDLAGDLGGAWFVGTFAQDVVKSQAVRTVGKFIKHLRKSQPGLEYASTWETTKAGRLHVNVVLAPWSFVRQKELSAAWERYGGGPVAWIERVGASSGIGSEVTKMGKKSRRKIGNYVAKWDQMVKEGRGVTFSRGWPKLPVSPIHSERYGEIKWRWVGQFEAEDIMFNYEREIGEWVEVAPGEFASAHGEECHCFDHVKMPKQKQSCSCSVYQVDEPEAKPLTRGNMGAYDGEKDG